MSKANTAIDPKPIVSLMFAVAVGFWASELAQYSFKLTGLSDPDVVVLASGVLFLIDLLCIVWWYAKYIYRVQPNAQFKTYFLDFVICSMFALAANSWTRSDTFLVATLCASTFLLVRFTLLYFGSDVSQTDRYILKVAGIALFVSLPTVVLSLHAVDSYFEGSQIFQLGLPGALSLIGIVLTICLKTKIDVAVSIYLAKTAPISTAYLVWPVSNQMDQQEQKEIRKWQTRIRHRTEAGLRAFEDIFRQFGERDRIHSRVHSETELRVQSYILALPSCDNVDYVEEIEKKAFMVAVSHWLDDLVDGRSELYVLKQLEKAPPLSDKKTDAEELFKRIYRPLIVKHTSRKFYERLCEMICRSCPLMFNLKYMLLGLNRVAYGSVIFSPRVKDKQRWEILNKNHNVFLKEWNDETKGDLELEVEHILDEIAGGEDVGPILQGLTTKTVQEVALSSENCEMSIPLSILYSILYAPLIYYHNIKQELQSGEMIPLQAFDTDSDLWVPWLRKVRNAIDKFDTGDRSQMRAKQIEMAYKCFEPMLPEYIRSRVRNIYLPKQQTEENKLKQLWRDIKSKKVKVYWAAGSETPEEISVQQL